VNGTTACGVNTFRPGSAGDAAGWRRSWWRVRLMELLPTVVMPRSRCGRRGPRSYSWQRCRRGRLRRHPGSGSIPEGVASASVALSGATTEVAGRHWPRVRHWDRQVAKQVGAVTLW